MFKTNCITSFWAQQNLGATKKLGTLTPNVPKYDVVGWKKQAHGMERSGLK